MLEQNGNPVDKRLRVEWLIGARGDAVEGKDEQGSAASPKNKKAMLEIGEDIHVAIRSYKRAGAVRTLSVVPFASVWVPESQGDEYRKHYGDRVITIPDDEDGGPGRKMNAILNRTPARYTVVMDDDVSKIGFWEGGEHLQMDADHVAEMIVQGFMLAEEMGVRLWGLNQSQENMNYRAFTPFSFLAPILGPFTAHLSPSLRYDESVFGKDDYDFWLQNIRTHRRTLRFNKYYYVHGHGGNVGGLVSMRTMEREVESIRRMGQKWGKHFRAGGTSGGRMAKGGNILNSRASVPIPGV